MKNILTFLKKYKLIIALLIVISIVITISILRNQKNNQPTTSIAKPIIQNLTETLELTGHIDAGQKADLRFSAPGRLAWVGVKEGDIVKKWQSIASLDTRTLQKQLEQDLNTFNKAFRTHDQVLDDNNYYGNPDISRELKRILENANYDLNNSVINLEIRDLAIKLSSLTTPIAGIITRIDQKNAGANIGITDTFQIIDPSTVYFSAEIDELDISKIKVGQKASIVFDAYEAETIDATISKIGFTPITGSMSGTSYKVELSFNANNQDLKYRLGMSGDAKVVLANLENVLTIPSQAIIERDGKYFVDLNQKDEKPLRKEVEIGLETDDTVEIKSGLTVNDEIVVPQ